MGYHQHWQNWGRLIRWCSWVALVCWIVWGGIVASPNVVLVIAGGMGPSLQVATRYYLGGPTHELAVDKMPVVGRIKTYSANSGVSDAGASGTALACGIKTNNGYVGMTADGQPCTTLLDVAKQQGYITALITNTLITDPTPASFFAHVNNRIATRDIVLQLANSGVDVMIGGGHGVLSPSINGLLMDVGWVVTSDLRGLGKGFPTLILPYSGAFPLLSTQPTWSIFGVMTELYKTIDQHPSPSFVVIDMGQMEGLAQRNRLRQLLKEAAEWDKVMGWLRERPNTLLVGVTDYDTGGLSIGGGRDWVGMRGDALWDGSGRQRVVVWAFGPESEMRMKGITITEERLESREFGVKAMNTAVDVGVVASGPFSNRLMGTMENSQVAVIVTEILGGSGIGEIKFEPNPKSTLPTKSVLPPEATLPPASVLPPEATVPTKSVLPPEATVPTASVLPPEATVPTASVLPPEAMVPTASVLPPEAMVPPASVLPPEATVPTASVLPPEATVPTASVLPSEATVPTASVLPPEATVPTASVLPPEATVPTASVRLPEATVPTAVE